MSDDVSDSRGGADDPVVTPPDEFADLGTQIRPRELRAFAWPAKLAACACRLIVASSSADHPPVVTQNSPPLRRFLALTIAGITSVVCLAGCTSTPSPLNSVSGAQPTVTATVTATPTSSPHDSSSVSATSSASPSTSAGAPIAGQSSGGGIRTDRCDTGNLRGSLLGGSGAAGSTQLDLQLRNTGNRACTLQGWPGVSFITGSGRQIGAAADFDRDSTHTTVTLQPGAHAHTTLTIVQALNFTKSACDPLATTRLRVYPPGSTASLIVTGSSMTACSVPSKHLLTVQALRAAN